MADHKACIIMLGESGVGKTSLMVRFCKNLFREAHTNTTIDFYSKTIVLNDRRIALELWDTAGTERFKAIIRQYFRRADGVVLVYDTTNMETFLKLSSWLDELRALNDEATVIIVGNKSDLHHRSQVTRQAVRNYAEEEGLDFCETSARNNENVEEVFTTLAAKVLERKKIAPFYTEMPNGEIKAESASNAGQLPAEGASNAGQLPAEGASNAGQPTAEGASNAGQSTAESASNTGQLPAEGASNAGQLPAEVASNASEDTVDSSSIAASGSRQQQTEDSLPPIIRLEDGFGDDIHWIKLNIEQPKKKKESCC